MNKVTERCPGCDRKLTWQLGEDYYCVGGKRCGTEFDTTEQGRDIQLFTCPYCSRMIGVTINNDFGAEVFVHSDSLIRGTIDDSDYG